MVKIVIYILSILLFYLSMHVEYIFLKPPSSTNAQRHTLYDQSVEKNLKSKEHGQNVSKQKTLKPPYYQKLCFAWLMAY